MTNNKMTNNKMFHLTRRWGPLVFLLILIGIANYTIYQDYQQAVPGPESEAAPSFSEYALGKLHTFRGQALDFAFDNPVISSIAFVSAYAASVALSLPIAALLSLLGGYLYGKWLGTFLIVTGATTGAVIIFLIARLSVGVTLREKTGKWYHRVEENMRENAAGYLLFMRLVPVFPFFVVNILPALFNISLGVYILTTFFGIIPGAFVYANLGKELGEIQELKDLVSKDTIFAFALLGLFALIPTLYKNYRTYLRGRTSETGISRKENGYDRYN